jgi:hypothetical protein
MFLLSHGPKPFSPFHVLKNGFIDDVKQSTPNEEIQVQTCLVSKYYEKKD